VLYYYPDPAHVSRLRLSKMLHHVARHGRGSVARLLIGAGADPSYTDGFDTPLHQACAFGNASTAAALLGAGADINAKNMHGRNAYQLAVANRHCDVLRLLGR
jgi:ankyrin repeat protein